MLENYHAAQIAVIRLLEQTKTHQHLEKKIRLFGALAIIAKQPGCSN